MVLTKGEKDYLIEHHKQIIEEHKKGIRWHEEAIKNNERRINQLNKTRQCEHKDCEYRSLSKGICLLTESQCSDCCPYN